MQVKLIEENNHNIEQYIVSVQEPFMVVTLGDENHARKFDFADAANLIEKISRATNGHRIFKMEY